MSADCFQAASQFPFPGSLRTSGRDHGTVEIRHKESEGDREHMFVVTKIHCAGGSSTLILRTTRQRPGVRFNEFLLYYPAILSEHTSSINSKSKLQFHLKFLVLRNLYLFESAAVPTLRKIIAALRSLAFH